METEEERQARRKARLEEMRREKRRRELLYKWGIPVVAGLAIVVGIGIGIGTAAFSHRDKGQQESRSESLAEGQGEDGTEGRNEDGLEDSENSAEDRTEDSIAVKGREGQDAQTQDPETGNMETRGKSRHAVQGLFVLAGKAYSPRKDFPGANAEDALQAGEPAQEPEPDPTPKPLGIITPQQNTVFDMTERTADFSETILSQYGVFIDAQSGEILAQREAYTRMNPASMTKMLTVLVAAEHLTVEDLDKTAAITIDITDYSYVNDCSNTGYALDEVVTVRDLFYGTILPSGADSALALAIYVAGSHEAFVELMNEKLVQMGLGETSHFTNCVGVYDEEHYSTAYDMAVILKATAENPFCRDVMSAHTYTTSLTKEHPEGLLISNWFLRRIEDKDTHGEVLCGKTGYVDQSGCCAASLGLDGEGRAYLCVTADSTTTWTCIDDHVELYQTYLPATESAPESASDAPAPSG